MAAPSIQPGQRPGAQSRPGTYEMLPRSDNERHAECLNRFFAPRRCSSSCWLVQGMLWTTALFRPHMRRCTSNRMFISLRARERHTLALAHCDCTHTPTRCTYRTLTSSRTTGIAAAAPGNVARFLRKQLSRSSSSGTSTAEGSRTEFGARVTPLPAEQSKCSMSDACSFVHRDGAVVAQAGKKDRRDRSCKRISRAATLALSLSPIMDVPFSVWRRA